MKTFKRTSLPTEIVHNKRIYVRTSEDEPANQTDYICVKVLHKALRNRLNIHGKPYEPTTWYFKYKSQIKNNVNITL